MKRKALYSFTAVVCLFLVVVVFWVIRIQHNPLALKNAQMVKTLYLEKRQLFDEAITIIQEKTSGEITIQMIRANETFPSNNQYRIGDILFLSGSYGTARFVRDCTAINATIAHLFSQFEFFRICLTPEYVLFAFEYENGYSSELYYVENRQSVFARNAAKTTIDETWIDEKWFAVITYDPENSP